MLYFLTVVQPGLVACRGEAVGSAVSEALTFSSPAMDNTSLKGSVPETDPQTL
ncbi:hypothetical protein WIMU106979_01595 [Williamsia muralis]